MEFRSRIYLNIGDTLEVSHSGHDTRYTCVEKEVPFKSCAINNDTRCAFRTSKGGFTVKYCSNVQCSAKFRPDNKSCIFLEIPFEDECNGNPK